MCSSCRHAMMLGDEAYCGLRSNREDGLGDALLVFHADLIDAPICCDAKMFRACPYKEDQEGRGISTRGAVFCDHCGKRHIPGSLSQKLCGEWHSFKTAHQETRRSLPGKRKWYLYGC